MTASLAMSMPTASIGSVPYDWPQRECSRIVVSGGSEWHVQRMGQGDTILLLHGTAASTHTWRDVMPVLAKSFDVVAIDLPGHGFSERLVGGSMSLDALGSGIAGLLQDLRISPHGIVGHSAGAAIALDLVLNRQIAARCVVGINAALLPFGGTLKNVFSPLARFFASTALMPKMLARRAGDAKAVERVLNGTGSVLDPAGLSFYQRLFRRETHLAAVLQMMASWDLRQLLSDMPGLTSRLMLIVGENDQAVSPKEADSVAGHVTDAEVLRLPGLGHLAHEEAPECVAALVAQFMAPERTSV